MAKEEWGSKHICPDCNTKFYDLQRDPVLCPKCGKLIVIDNTDSTKPPVEEERVLADDDPAVTIEDGDDTDVEIDDNVLDDSDDDTISLEEISDIPDE